MAPGSSVRVVSRSAELGAVAALLASARREPSCLVLEGPPGIGKTTVWTAALQIARKQGFQVLSTRPTAAESVLAYASLADLLADAEAADVGADSWPDLPQPQRLAIDQVMLRATPESGPTDPRAVAAGFGSVVTRLTMQGPVLLAVDDMQWLDSSSAAALAFVVRRLSGPVAVLGAARVDESGPAHQVQLDGPAGVRQLRLPPLDLAGTRAAVAQCLDRPVAGGAMLRIHQISGGNPFYAVELARAMTDRSASELADMAEIPLPTTLSQLVRTRMSGIDDNVLAALLAAASASAPTLELVAGALGDTAEHVAQLLESTSGVINVHGAAVRFTHPLLAWGVYTDAEPAARRAMHRRLAELVDEPERRARHLASAATGPEERTVEALDEAAELAVVRGAPSAAAELIGLAIALGADTAQRRIRLAANLFTAGDSTAARTHLEAVLSAPGRGVHRATAMLQLAVISLSEGSWATGDELLTRALTEAADDCEVQARVLIPLSLAQMNDGRFEVASRTIGDAITAAEAIGGPAYSQLLSQALSMRVIVDFMRGNGFDHRIHTRALALEQRDAPTWVQLRPTVHAASLLAWTGDLDQAHKCFTVIRRDLLERGQESELMFVAFLAVLTEVWRSDFAAARSMTHDALERTEHLDGLLPQGVALMLCGLLDVYNGREQDARARIENARGAIERSGSNYLTGWLTATLGFLEVSLGKYSAALSVLEPALARVMAKPAGTEIFTAGFLPDAIEAMVGTGRLDAAEAAIAILEENGRRLDRAWMMAVAGRCRAMLLAARGDADGAAAAVERALAEHGRLGMPFERARTLLVLGQVQRRQRRKNAAATTLRTVVETFEQLDTPLWAEKARSELRRVQVDAGADGELTASERRVAELLASGMTRRQVGAELFISPKTVEAHLARIYRKLGIRSRAELGRYVATLDS